MTFVEIEGPRVTHHVLLSFCYPVFRYIPVYLPHGTVILLGHKKRKFIDHLQRESI